MFENCLIVKMKRSRPAQVVRDSAATASYNEEKEADASGIYKHLFKNEPLVNALNNCYTNMYLFHTKNSRPWLDEGMRMIDGVHYLDYIKGVDNFRTQLQDTLTKIKEVYDEMVQRDIVRLKNLGNACDYPSYDSYAASWKVDVNLRPVPQKGDFRVQIPQEVADGLEQQLQDLGVKISSSLRSEIKGAFDHVYSQLNKPDAERRLFTSLLDNLHDLLDRVPILNLCGDPDVNSVASGLTTVIANYNIKELRLYEAARRSFISETKALLETL